MATLALVGPDGELTDGDKQTKVVKDRIRQGREYRKQFEPTWRVNMAFAAGEHYLVFDDNTRTLRRIQDVDPKYKGREQYSADIITEYRTTVLGELGSDDDRPELLLQHDDTAAEDFQAQLNRALGFGWDNEFRADEVLAEADRLCLDLGTSAIQCRFDAAAGEVRPEGEIPHYQGKPVLDMEQATQLMGGGPNPEIQMQEMHQGRITWEALSAMNLIVPPGLTHERRFPWECVVDALLLADAKAEYGKVAGDLREDGDIATDLGQVAQNASFDAVRSAIESRKTRLREHVWRFRYYERPSRQHKQGRVLTFLTNELKLVRVEPRLPYVGPDGVYRSGIAYFHWWRTTGRFWSRGLVEALRDAQRAMNKRRMQANEIIDRGTPFVMVEKNSEALKRVGLPLELIQLAPQERQPVISQGAGPGPWMQQEYQQIRDDAEHAAGVRAPTLGDNPTNVNTYSQLALLREADQVKREPILIDRKLSIKQLVEDSVYDMRTYWGPERQVMLAGDNKQVEAHTFNATKIPTFFIVHIAKGSAKPRTQAAQLKLIEQLWQAAVEIGIAVQNPAPWAKWLYDSLEAGQPLELPDAGSDAHHEKASRENHLLMQGEMPEVAYYDPAEVHVPVHRLLQIQADQTGDMQLWQRAEQHIKAHEQAGQANAQQIAQMIPQVPGAPPMPDPNQPAELAQQDVHHQEKLGVQQQQMLLQAAQQQQQQQNQ